MDGWFDLPEAARITEMSYPTRVVFGVGALERLPAQVSRLKMTRPLVVTDPGVVKAGLAEKIFATLKAAGVPYEVFSAVAANPTEKDIELGLATFRASGCDGFIALGGGSPIDAAKVIQLSVTHPPPLSRYDDATGGDRFVNDDMPPLIAIPTTAGTGSEVGRAGVITLADTGRKTVLFSPYLLPKAVIADPALTFGLPPAITAATGMDAFTHCLESYLATGFHPLADALAIDGIARVARSLEVAYRDGTHARARSDMMIAAMEGAMAFQKGLGAAHALAHALTPISGVHHGLANAVVLPFVLDFNREIVAPRLARVAVAMGEPPGAGVEPLADAAVAHVRALCRSLKLAERLRDVGVKEADLPRIAQKAFEDASHGSNPRPCTEADLLGLARAAF